MKNFLSPDSKFGRVLYGMGKLIILSWLWLICSIPIFTIGAASSALYDITRRVISGTERKIASDFFASFRSNFKQATPLWLIVLPICIILAYSLSLFLVLNDSSTIGKLIVLCAVLIVALFLCWITVVFSYLARFEDTFKTAAKNCFVMCILNPLNCFWIIAQGAAVVYFLTIIPFITWLPTILSLAPACYCALMVTPIERIFADYIPKDPPAEGE